MERLTMSSREIKRLELMRRLSDKTLTQAQVGETLGVSERQVRRLLRRYEASGAAELISGRLLTVAMTRPSNKQSWPRFGNVTVTLVLRWRLSICSRKATRSPKRRCANGWWPMVCGSQAINGVSVCIRLAIDVAGWVSSYRSTAAPTTGLRVELASAV